MEDQLREFVGSTIWAFDGEERCESLVLDRIENGKMIFHNADYSRKIYIFPIEWCEIDFLSKNFIELHLSENKDYRMIFFQKIA